MFKRPEEIIVLILAVLWIVGTYFLAALFGADAYTVLKITALTLLWSAASFLLWQKNLSRYIWPLLLGCLTACWWPYLNQSVAPGSLPWYASWTFKTILALIPITAGYLFKWKQYRQRKTKP